MEWTTITSQGSKAVHTLIVDGVLCRWWGDEEPAGARRIVAGVVHADALAAALETMGADFHAKTCYAAHSWRECMYAVSDKPEFTVPAELLRAYDAAKAAP